MLRTLMKTTALMALVAIPLACDSGTDPVTVGAVDLIAPVDVLPAGQTVDLEVHVEDDEGDPITNPDVDYESSSTAIATVNQNGVITGVGEGEVIITATSGAFTDEVSLYIFDFTDLCAEALGIPFNEPVRANLQQGDCTEIYNDGSYTDLWFFELTQERAVTVELESADFDTYLEILDSTGGDVAADDDSGGGVAGTDSRIQQTLPAGTYFILANHYPPETGVYTLTVATSTTADPALRAVTVQRARALPEMGVRKR